MAKSFDFVNVVEKPHDVMEYPFPEGSHFSIDDGISDGLFKMMSETVGYDMSMISRDANIAHFNLYFKEKESKVRVFCEMHDNIFYLLYIDRNHETHKQTIEKRLEMDKLTEANRKAAMSLAKSLKR